MSSTSAGITFRFDEGTVHFLPTLGEAAGRSVRGGIHTYLGHLQGEHQQEKGTNLCDLEVSRAISNTAEHSKILSKKFEEREKFEALINPGLKKVMEKIEVLIEQHFNEVYKAKKAYWAMNHYDDIDEILDELKIPFQKLQDELRKLVQVECLLARNIFSRNGNYKHGPDSEKLKQFSFSLREEAITEEELCEFFTKSLVSHCHLNFGERIMRNFVEAKRNAELNPALLNSLEMTQIFFGRYVNSALGNGLAEYGATPLYAPSDEKIYNLYREVLQEATKECYHSLKGELQNLAEVLPALSKRTSVKLVFFKPDQVQLTPLEKIKSLIYGLDSNSTEAFIPKLIKIHHLANKITKEPGDTASAREIIMKIADIHETIAGSAVWKSTALFWTNDNEILRKLGVALANTIEGDRAEKEDEILVAFKAKALAILKPYTVIDLTPFLSSKAVDLEQATIDAHENIPIRPQELYQMLKDVLKEAEEARVAYTTNKPPVLLANIVETIQKHETYKQWQQQEMETQATIATLRPKGAR